MTPGSTLGFFNIELNSEVQLLGLVGGSDMFWTIVQSPTPTATSRSGWTPGQ